jgi:predicted nucleotidyltransferase
MGREEPLAIAEADEIVARLRAALTVSAVVIFGSRAQGEHTQRSDIDLAVVSSEFADEPRMYRRVERLQEALRGLRRLDVVGLAPAELEALDCLLVLDIVDDGWVLHDDGVFDRARKNLEEKRKNGRVERIRGGWRIVPEPVITEAG